MVHIYWLNVIRKNTKKSSESKTDWKKKQMMAIYNLATNNNKIWKENMK